MRFNLYPRAQYEKMFMFNLKNLTEKCLMN